jgi:hypothetical protein
MPYALRLVLRETVLKYSSYWSTASPQLHGPKAKPDSTSKLKALRGVVATQTELLKAGQSAASTRPCPRGARHPEVPEAHAATWPAQRRPLGPAGLLLK